MESIELPPEEHFPDGDVPDDDIRAEAQTNRRKLVEAGDLLTAASLQVALSTSKQALSLATRERKLFMLNIDGNEYYPAFFARPVAPRRTLEHVCQELGSLPGWLKWDFFTAPRETLGRMSALEALADGEEELVCKVARGFLADNTD
ncbi:MAG: hypothetical protein WCA85_15515 [Paraburkholderia sp.]|uniref:hypothetical protein n=1 Tax=Paraburkholderia sp. TaxID=1926495 RepID=UPI003C5F8BDB